MKSIRALAVDDHEITTYGCKTILENMDWSNLQVRVDRAITFAQAIDKIDQNHYDLLLLDLRLDKDEDGKVHWGDDLALYAREHKPNAKIVFMTTYSDNYKINEVLQKTNPDGYMVKIEIREDTVRDMVQSVMNDIPYYSPEILKALRASFSQGNALDETDRRLLHEIEKGVSTKELSQIISLSIPSIEGRKSKIKSMFGIPGQNDLKMIAEAKNRGFI